MVRARVALNPAGANRESPGVGRSDGPPEQRVTGKSFKRPASGAGPDYLLLKPGLSCGAGGDLGLGKG